MEGEKKISGHQSSQELFLVDRSLYKVLASVLGEENTKHIVKECVTE